MGGTGEDDLRLGCQDKGVDGWGSEGVGGTERRQVGKPWRAQRLDLTGRWGSGLGFVGQFGRAVLLVVSVTESTSIKTI